MVQKLKTSWPCRNHNNWRTSSRFFSPPELKILCKLQDNRVLTNFSNACLHVLILTGKMSHHDHSLQEKYQHIIKQWKWKIFPFMFIQSIERRVRRCILSDSYLWLYNKDQSRLHLLRRSFGVQGEHLSGLFLRASAIFYSVVCWCCSISTADRKTVDKLIMSRDAPCAACKW